MKIKELIHKLLEISELEGDLDVEFQTAFDPKTGGVLAKPIELLDITLCFEDQIKKQVTLL